MQNIIIDANNMLYRAIAVSEKYIKTRGVEPTYLDDMNLNYIQSFFWVLYNSISDFYSVDSEIYLVWDKKLIPNSTNWRNDINPDYKQQRNQESELRKSVVRTTPHIKKVADKMGIITVYPLTSECDDVMNYLTKILDGNTVIVSSDADFLQCVSDTTCVYSPFKKVVITKQNFEEHVDVSLNNFVKWKSIKGDASDNIKGLYKYGDKKAKKLVENWDELSPKLSSEELEIIKETMEIIDLNARPLTEKEIYAVKYQINFERTPLSLYERKRLFEKFKFSNELQSNWEEYINLKEMGNFYN